MKKCCKCGSKFSVKDRIKACFDKYNTLKCQSCGTKFEQSMFDSKLSFYIPTIIYIIISYKLTVIINKYTNSLGVSILLSGIIAFLWIITFMVLSQFWFKYNKKGDVKKHPN